MTLHIEKKHLFLAFVILVIVAAGIYAGSLIGRADFAKLLAPRYTVVYLTSGDMYFGKFSWFPRPHLRNVWYLERGVSGENLPQLGVTAFESAVWGPRDVLYLNPTQILWKTELRSDSPLLQAMRANRQAVAEGDAQQNGAVTP